ncbi:MAG: 50S ribosomal protein L5 [Elusimicrobia bacterium]|nr:50S ribosomal protein L5 [Elusimicrobiota bacterium]
MAETKGDKAAGRSAKEKALADKAAREAAKAAAPKAQGETKHDVPRLKTQYREKIVPALMESLGLENPMQAPRLVKIVINVGVSDAKDNIQNLDVAREELSAITGQLPQIRRAKKSISNFKLRQGMPIGLRVTLRNDRMYEFADRLIALAIPRIRDFRGLEPNGFDGQGNYNLGLREQHIFSEVSMEKSPRARGMNITFVTTAGNDAAGLELLIRLGMPFKKRGEKAAAKAEPAAVAVAG